MGSANVALGAQGEAFAASWYERRGYVVIERNWRCRDGEIDLIAQRGSLLVFCEVKTRRSTRYGSPAQAVDWRKQRTIRRVARQYLASSADSRAEAGPCRLRFDVAAVLANHHGMAIEVLESAF